MHVVSLCWTRSSRPRLTHQVALAVAFINQVPGVAPAVVTKRILAPLVVGAIIVLHEASQEVDVDIVTSQTRRRTKCFLQPHYEFLETVLRERTHAGRDPEADGVGEDADCHGCVV